MADEPTVPVSSCIGEADNRLPQIPDHEVLRSIGNGTFGVIFLVRTVTGRYRAAKVISRTNFRSESSFVREFAGVQKIERISLEHEGWVDILHVGRNDGEGFYYYIMELADDVLGGESINPLKYRSKNLAREIERSGR